MSRKELIKSLKKKNPNLNKSELENIIDTFCKVIQNALNNDKNVELRGFGSFFKNIKYDHSLRLLDGHRQRTDIHMGNLV